MNLHLKIAKLMIELYCNLHPFLVLLIVTEASIFRKMTVTLRDTYVTHPKLSELGKL